MSYRIIYKDEDGNLVKIIPTDEAVKLIGIPAIAGKDVPAGVDYQIVDSDNVPETVESVDGTGWDVGVGTDWTVMGYLNPIEVLIKHNTTGQTGVYTILTKEFSLEPLK